MAGKLSSPGNGSARRAGGASSSLAHAPKENVTAKIQEFLQAIRASENTKLAYASTMSVFWEWSGGALPESADDCQRFIDWRVTQGRKPATIAKDAAALVRYLEWRKLPARKLERPAVTLGEPKYLSEEDVGRLLRACETTMEKALVALLYDTGARISEVLSITVADIDWEGYLRNVRRKGGRVEGAVNVTTWGMGYLRAWLQVRDSSSPLLFNGYERRQAAAMLLRAAKRASLEHFSPHMLRHSRGTHLLHNQHVPLENVSYQLGHTSTATTSRLYTRLRAQDNKPMIPAPHLE